MDQYLTHEETVEFARGRIGLVLSAGWAGGKKPNMQAIVSVLLSLAVSEARRIGMPLDAVLQGVESEWQDQAAAAEKEKP